MIARFQFILHRATLAFVVLLCAWILVRSGNMAALAVTAIFAAAIVSLRLLPASASAQLSRSSDLARRIVGALLRPCPVVVIAIVALGARLAWSLHFDVRLISDYRQFHDMARQFAAGDLAVMGQSKSPVTVALYGLLYELPFRPLAIAQVTNAVLGAAQAVCIYAIARRAFASTVAGRFAGMVFALTPSAVMYSVLPASEPFFFTLLLVLMWLCMRLAGAATTMPMRGAVTTAALAGAAAALLHLTRNAGIAYALWAAVAAMLWARAGAVRTAVVGGTFLATMLLCLFPQAVYNYKTYGAISLQSSKYAGLNFLSGTNRESSGQHNPRDVAFVRNQFGDEHWNEAMKAARSRALRRIREDVPGFFAFALTEKFDVMWCEDTYAAMTHPVCMWRGKLLPWRSMSQGFYVALVALGAAGACLAFARGTGGLAIVTAGGILAMTFLLHVFIEVQPRYHAVLVYLLPIFASALVAGKETPQDD